MKTKNVILPILLGFFGLLIIGFVNTQAAKDRLFTPPKIGIVSIRAVFDDCPLKAAVEKDLSADGEKKYEELKGLQQQIDSDKSALDKRKPDTSDYLDILQALMLKQAELKTKQEFYKQSLALKEVQGKEKIYREILKAISKVAQNLGLDMVVSRDDNYLNDPNDMPAPQSPDDFTMISKTNKLLYYNKSLDITDLVLAEMKKDN